MRFQAPEANGVFKFEPDGTRACALDAAMHRELASSLDHIREAIRGILDHTLLADVVGRIRAGEKALPSTFARYYELVDALNEGALPKAQGLIERLAETPPPASQLQVCNLGDVDLGEDSARFSRMLRENGPDAPAMLPPAAATATAFRSRLTDGMALLRAAVPELAREISGLVRQIVLVGADPHARYQLDGGSHYQLWGALFLNAHWHRDAVAVAEVLAHESAHSLLFGLCIDEPLVENGPEERFASPLRADARPMDGVFHATFVSARMHWTMTEISGNPMLTSAQQASARAAAVSNARNFYDGVAVVQRHARLTGLGSKIMEATRRYMRTFAEPGAS